MCVCSLLLCILKRYSWRKESTDWGLVSYKEWPHTCGSELNLWSVLQWDDSNLPQHFGRHPRWTSSKSSVHTKKTTWYRDVRGILFVWALELIMCSQYFFVLKLVIDFVQAIATSEVLQFFQKRLIFYSVHHFHSLEIHGFIRSLYVPLT